MKLTIKIRQKDQEILVKELGEGVYRLGRSEFCDIALPSEKVSRTHLEFRVTELSVYLTNMSTSGKVKVNRELIETCELHDGDEVQVGPYRIEVLLNAGVVAESSPAEPQADVPFNENNSNVIEGGFKKDQPQEPAFDGNLALAVEAPAAELMVNERNSSIKYKNDTQVEVKPLVAKILFQTGPKQGQECSIEGFEIVIGRSKRADIQVEDNKLSRLHCKIVRVGMGYRLMDLQSKRGTYVNGVRVLEHPLASFDEVEIGDTKFKFLVHDMVMGNPVGGPLAAVGDTLAGTRPAITKSLAIGAINPELMDELKNQGPDPYLPHPNFEPPARTSILSQVSQRTKVLALVVVGLLALYLLMPDSSKTKKVETAENKATMEDKLSKIELPPTLPKEYGELSEEVQRAIEGQYHSAQSAAEQGRYEEAVAYLKQIHENLPFYKQSRELMEQYSQKLREKQIAEAQEKAKKDEKQDLAIYLEDGLAYLREGEFEKAAEVFNSAIVLDPTNLIAVKGLKAAELKIRDIEAIPPEIDPEDEKRKLVTDLFQKAIVAFSNKSYQEAIDIGQKIKQIELQGDKQYVQEAQTLIDKAKAFQKEQFEPFLIQAKEKYAEGDYNASREICEEMLKQDSTYDEAKECSLKAKKQLNRLAKEAYTHGYILESMNRIEEAKQYWNRAKNFVRPGDEYYDKVMKKLEHYQ